MPVLTQVSQQGAHAVTVNDNFRATAVASSFGVKNALSAGLTFAYYGGYVNNGGANVLIADGTLSLTGSATNYIERTAAGVVSSNTSAFTGGRIPLYTAVTSASGITTLVDYRTPGPSLQDAPSFGGLIVTGALTYGGVTLTNAVTGTGSMVLSTSPTLVTPLLGTPTSGNLTNCTGYVGTSTLVTTGALNSGSITSGFGAIDIGTDTLAAGNTTITGTLSATGNITSSAGNLGMAYTGVLYWNGASNTYLQGDANNLYLGVGGSARGLFTTAGLAVTGTLSATSYIEGVEEAAPAAPAANGYRIFAQDNGAGKTQLMVIFATGAAQQLAIQP